MEKEHIKKTASSTKRFTLGFNLRKEEQKKAKDFLDRLGRRKTIYIAALIDRHLTDLGVADVEQLDEVTIQAILNNAILQDKTHMTSTASNFWAPPNFIPYPYMMPQSSAPVTESGNPERGLTVNPDEGTDDSSNYMEEDAIVNVEDTNVDYDDVEDSDAEAGTEMASNVMDIMSNW